AIVFVPAESYQDKPPQVSCGPFLVTPERSAQLSWLSGMIGVLILMVVAGVLGWPLWQRYRQRQQPPPPGQNNE
ncbi:EscJ/YscJ/HrcJ family type III secretion inner membrane ring protein, partial [Erwinia amylovora]|nr:EscJ/YscJ/HrcJ family type III secretion inner membrane ring protein [Erwinia amylovora]